MLKPTALPSLPDVVASVLALVKVLVFSLHTKCCRFLYTCSTWLLIVDKVLVPLVDAEVGDVPVPGNSIIIVALTQEMELLPVFVINILGSVAVLLCGKSHEAILVKVNPERTDGGHEDIHPEVKHVLSSL